NSGLGSVPSSMLKGAGGSITSATPGTDFIDPSSVPATTVKSGSEANVRNVLMVPYLPSTTSIEDPRWGVVSDGSDQTAKINAALATGINFHFEPNKI